MPFSFNLQQTAAGCRCTAFELVAYAKTAVATATVQLTLTTVSTIALTLAGSTAAAVAQAPAPNPTYTAGGQTKLVTQVSPAITQYGSTLFLIYGNNNDGGTLYAAPNTSGGLNFGSPGAKMTSYRATSGVSAVGVNGVLYAAAATGNAIYLYQSTDGVNWRQSLAVGSPYNPSSTARPVLANWNNQLVLAFLSGSTIRTAIYTGNGTFSVNASSPGPGAASGPALYGANGQLNLAYLSSDGSGHPIVCASTDANSNFNSGSPCNVDNSIQFGNDPTLLLYNNTLVLQGKSHYSEDELWGTTVYGNLTFSPQYKYGQTLTQSPGLSTFNGNHIYECARSKNGSNIWCYYN